MQCSHSPSSPTAPQSLQQRLLEPPNSRAAAKESIIQEADMSSMPWKMWLHKLIFPGPGPVRRQDMSAFQYYLAICIHYIVCLLIAPPLLAFHLSVTVFHFISRQRELRPPQPEKRKRRLSISEEADGPRAQSQAHSPFFKLPLELRMLIYEEIVGNRVVHIMFPWKLQGHRYICSTWCTCVTEKKPRPTQNHCFPGWKRPKRGRKGPKPYVMRNCGIGVLPLISSCRRM